MPGGSELHSRCVSRSTHKKNGSRCHYLWRSDIFMICELDHTQDAECSVRHSHVVWLWSFLGAVLVSVGGEECGLLWGWGGWGACSSQTCCRRHSGQWVFICLQWGDGPLQCDSLSSFLKGSFFYKFFCFCMHRAKSPLLQTSAESNEVVWFSVEFLLLCFVSV